MPPASHSTSRLSTAGRLERRTGPFRPYQSRRCFSFVSIALFGESLGVDRPQRVEDRCRWGLIAGGVISTCIGRRDSRRREEDGCFLPAPRVAVTVALLPVICG